MEDIKRENPFMKNWGAIIIKRINLRRFHWVCCIRMYNIPHSLSLPFYALYALKKKETIIYKILIVSRLVFQTVQVQYNEPIGNCKGNGSKTII